MAESGQINSVFLAELMESTTVNDTDILAIEDTENTKKISARNLKKGFISDDESPASHRIYSSKKVSDMMTDFTTEVNTTVGRIQASVDDLSEDMITQTELDEALLEFDNIKADKSKVAELEISIADKRDVSTKITSNDLSVASDYDKIHIENLGQDVISAMIGQTPIDEATAPAGGWPTEDIADGSITGVKLSPNYRYKGTITTGSLNRLTDDGIYVVMTTVEGIPGYDSYDDTPRFVEVTRYGEDNKYIIQKVYLVNQNSTRVIPWYERRGLFSVIHTLDFVAHYEIKEDTLIAADMLAAQYGNRGIVSSGDIFDLDDGQYMCIPGVENLPDGEGIYVLDIRSYGSRKVFVARSIKATGVNEYESYYYLDSTNLPVQTPWSRTTDTTKSKFDNKKVHLFGDSLMYGAGASDPNVTTIEALLSNKYGYSTNNHALLDATVGNYRDDILTASSLLTQISTAPRLSTADYAIIFIGSEDFRQGVLMGDESYFDEITFMGSYNSAIKNLLEINPNLKVLIATPVFRGSIAPYDGLNTDDTSINDRKLVEFVNAIKTIAAKNHIPCVDLYSESMINKYTKDVYLNENGIYLTDTGYELIADKIHDAMCKYY